MYSLWFRIVNLPNQFQCANHCTNGAALLVAIGNARVFDSLVVQANVIGVARKNHSTLREGERYMISVISSEQSHVAGSRHIDTKAAQTVSKRRVAVFVKMEADCSCHPCLPASA
jgi:hypothetical protein